MIMTKHEPWEAHSFDGIEKETTRELGKVFRSFFGDEIQFRPAVGMHQSFLPYSYFVEQTVSADEQHTSPLKHVFKIACAGYAKENIKVNRKDNVLNVIFEQPDNVTETGDITNEDGSKTIRIVKHSGLTAKSGKISWFIKNLSNADVKSCAVKNGILTIIVEEREPVDNSINIEIE